MMNGKMKEIKIIYYYLSPSARPISKSFQQAAAAACAHIERRTRNSKHSRIGDRESGDNTFTNIPSHSNEWEKTKFGRVVPQINSNECRCNAKPIFFFDHFGSLQCVYTAHAKMIDVAQLKFKA